MSQQQQLDLDKDLCLYTLHIGREILHKETPLPSVIINLLLAYCSIYEVEPPPKFPASLIWSGNDPEIQQLLHPEKRVTDICMSKRYGKSTMLVKFCLMKERECKCQGIPMPKILFMCYGKCHLNHCSRTWKEAREKYNWMIRDDPRGSVTFTSYTLSHLSQETKDAAFDILVLDDFDQAPSFYFSAQGFSQVILTRVKQFNSSVLLRQDETATTIVKNKPVATTRIPKWIPSLAV